MIKIVLSISFMFFLTGCLGPSVDRSGSVIVIDAGHGGHDTGATEAGKREKDLVLQITQKLYKEFRSEGYRVYMTRGNDCFLKLGQRTRIADKKDAQVFISVHANAISDRSRFNDVEGVETYYPDFTYQTQTTPL
ncbi:MAG: N-acetylmuramoyl-L-alanine amidase [Epsilonproteobacteria bacterium]|nr:N-acetylmuramoyl-L-alanine amidase [Campylobacterota bacterium]